jgi:hypothetical protein
MSTYHELDVNGVIDHAKLATYDGGRFARNEWAIPDFLNHNRRSVLPLVLPADSDQNRRATQQ